MFSSASILARKGLAEIAKKDSSWVNIEQPFTLDDVDLDARGTNDASIYVPGETLIVYDFKYGKGVPVEVIENKR